MMLGPHTKEYELVETDVLVVGGGLAAGFTAIKAAEAGAKVTLVDKGFFGRSGCSPIASGVYIYFNPEEDDLDAWVENYAEAAEYLIDQDLARKDIEDSYETVTLMEEWGVEFVRDDKGKILREKGTCHTACRTAVLAKAVFR